MSCNFKPMQVTDDTTLANLYNRDYYQWLLVTAKFLRMKKLAEVELENLAEEIEDLGRSQRTALKSNLIILLMHLLKYKYQSTHCESPHSWRSSIVEHRRRIELALEDSPSLKPYYLEVFEQCYAKARKDAAMETGVPLETFPTDCPLTIEQVLQQDFLPS